MSQCCETTVVGLSSGSSFFFDNFKTHDFLSENPAARRGPEMARKAQALGLAYFIVGTAIAAWGQEKPPRLRWQEVI